MLVSLSFLNKAMNDRAKAVKKNKEGYSLLESTNAGISLGFATSFLIIAIVFLALELLVLFYSIQIAITCTKAGPERVVNIVLAITFTFPYALFNILFNPCAKKTLGGL